MRHARLRDSVRFALGIDDHTARPAHASRRLALGALGLLAGQLFAQDDAVDQSTPTKLETITVTGSHVRRVDVETANPVITIDRQTIEKSGRLTLGDLVQQLPVVTGPNVNPQVNNGGGSGFSSIGLRGLGSPRTLVLINGHRFLDANPNDIPANMVERIEVLTDGASSVYGSDAVAGVVNFILRSDYQGAEFTATYGVSDRDDGAQRGYQFTFGQSTDKGSIMAGINYNKTDQVVASHRDFSKSSVSLYGTQYFPPQTFVGGSNASPYGHIQTPDAFRDIYPCNFLARNPGTSGQNVATDYHCYVNNGTATTPSDRYNFASVTLIMTPQERTGLYLNGNYKLPADTEAYASILHTKAASAFQLAPAVYRARDGAIISAESYYNPFHVEFSPDASAFDARLQSLGNRRGEYGANDDQLSTGFRGSLEGWSDQSWDWDAGLDYGHLAYRLASEGLPNLRLMNPSTGPSYFDPDTGTVRCGTPGHPIGGCVPVNIFDLDDPQTIAALRAAASAATKNIYAQQRILRADLHGGIVDLPAGAAQLAVGASRREEHITNSVDTSLRLDPATFTCTLGSQCGAPFQGGFDVKEIYAEIFVPVVKDAPFAHALNLTLGDRYSKYSNFGSTGNAKLAIEWRPIEDLLARGTVSDVFRAPSAFDLFNGARGDAPLLSHDPCDGYTGNPPDPACAHVPDDGAFRNQNVAERTPIDAIVSGSEYAGVALQPEFGRSFDFGVVYDPHGIEDLSMSVDLWRLYLDNNIVNAGAQTILDLCSAGQLSLCPLIRRFAGGPNAGQIDTVFESAVNLGRTDAKGVDVSVKYRIPESPLGRVSVGLNATYLAQYDVSTAPGTASNAVYHYAGHFMPLASAQAAACVGGSGGGCLFPRWRAQTYATWQRGRLDASWRMRYIGRFRMGSPAPAQDTFPAGQCYYGDYCTIHGLYLDYGATVFHDVQFGYNLEAWNTRFDVGINNLGDKQPPFLYANNTLNANTDPSDFDLVGRFYWCSVSVKF